MLDAFTVMTLVQTTDDPHILEDDGLRKKLVKIYAFPENPDFSRDGISGLSVPDEDSKVFDADDLDPHNSNVPSPLTSASSSSSGCEDPGGSAVPQDTGAEVTPEIIQDISDLINSFKPDENFKCVECAQTIEDYLKDRNIRGRRIKVDTVKKVRQDDFIYDDSLPPEVSDGIISENGHHE